MVRLSVNIPGDDKVERKFLWLPLTLEGITKWLCTVEIEYLYIVEYDPLLGHVVDRWKPIRFK